MTLEVSYAFFMPVISMAQYSSAIYAALALVNRNCQHNEATVWNAQSNTTKWIVKCSM